MEIAHSHHHLTSDSNLSNPPLRPCELVAITSGGNEFHRLTMHRGKKCNNKESFSSPTGQTQVQAEERWKASIQAKMLGNAVSQGLTQQPIGKVQSRGSNFQEFGALEFLVPGQKCSAMQLISKSFLHMRQSRDKSAFQMLSRKEAKS